MNNGVLLVKGKSFRTFIDEEFPKIADLIENIHTPVIAQVDYNKGEMETIWQDITKNRNAINTLESSVLMLLDGNVATETGDHHKCEEQKENS